MLIAKEKKNSNISEYLIYMFQIEDIIRASKFDLNIIEKNIISQYQINDKDSIREWYLGLIEMMMIEKIEKTGHLQFITNTINEVNNFHIKLLESHDVKYTKLFHDAENNIQEFRKRSKSIDLNEIEICLNGLYSLLLLRLRKKEISEDTKKAFDTFSKMLAYLSLKYKKFESGKFEFI